MVTNTHTASTLSERQSADANPIPIQISDLTVAYHRKPVLWDINLSIPEGQLVAVVGPNGACLLYTSDAADDDRIV